VKKLDGRLSWQKPISKIAPCLWFDDQAEDAANFYVSTFRGCGQEAAIGDIMRYAASGGPKPKRSVMSATFTLAGQSFIALNGSPHFTFSPATSLFVTCVDQAEVDRFWDGLSEGGQPGRCGWLTDRFGVSWQIVPKTLGAILQDADRAKSERVRRELMGMTKLDLAALNAAYQGGSAV
jgi:predicted 3-demethylubiquinone-9 3-methyltransferase (glyoxalase superfamily)